MLGKTPEFITLVSFDLFNKDTRCTRCNKSSKYKLLDSNDEAVSLECYTCKQKKTLSRKKYDLANGLEFKKVRLRD